MGDGFFSIDVPLHHAILINADSSQHIQCVFIAGINSIKDQADHDFLPGRPSLVPKLRLFQIYNIADILHHTMEGASR